MTHFAKRHYEAIALAMQEAKPECMVHLCFHHVVDADAPCGVCGGWISVDFRLRSIALAC
jgi:hypothetical protein